MRTRRMRIRWPLLLLPIIFLVAAWISATPLTTATVQAAPRTDCAGPIAGRHVYDCAGLLTPAETANLETQAALVEQAGAPTIVYLQVRDATAQQTLQDAIDLMNRWNVESHPGAHDGFVMFFNLQSGNLRHGQVALYAGERHYAHGNLPQAELDRVRTDVMTPLLQSGQTADGIAAGLQMVAHDLRYGPPPPPAYQTAAATIGRLPLSLLSLLFAGAVALLSVRLSRRPPVSSAGDETGGRASPATPGDLPPAMAGALVNGRVADAQIEGTILDFARRGLLVLEPAPFGKDKPQVRLLGAHDADSGLADYERETWKCLVTLAGGDQETIASDDLPQLRQTWGKAKTLLRRELIERGWYDPEAASARRRPLYILGALGMLGVVLALVLLFASMEGWAVIGLAIFLGAGTVAFIRGHGVLDTTIEGQIAAAPWRAYRDSVTAHDYQPNLDNDLPYIVALGIVGKLTPRLKAASEAGYSPSWFRAPGDQPGQQREGWRTPVVGFYPYWFAFHTSAAPVSSGSASGGYMGGGAAGGGGGSAGGF